MRNRKSLAVQTFSSLQQSSSADSLERYTVFNKTTNNTVYQNPCSSTVKDQLQHNLTMLNTQQKKNDKLQQCYENIFTYLAEHKYDQVLTIRMLQNPNQKLFASIFKFLISIYDPYLNIQQLCNDEIPEIMKFLGYPTTLSKNIFINIGAPYSWNHIINLLSWLVNILKYKEEAVQEDEQRQKIQSTITDIEIINEYIAESFAKGSQADHQENSEQYVQGKLLQRQNRIVSDQKEQETKIETIKLSIKNIQNDQPDLHELDLKISQEQEKIFREKEYIIQHENEIKELNAEVDDCTNKLGHRKTQIDKLASQKKEVESIIQQQEFDTTKASQYQQQIMQDMQLKQRLLEQKNDKQVIRNQLNQQLQLLFEETDKIVNEYNQILSTNSSDLLNQTQQIIAKINYDIFKEPIKENVKQLIDKGDKAQLLSGIINFDINNQARPLLESITVQNKDTIQELNDQIKMIDNEIQAFDNKLVEHQTEKNNVKRSLAQQEEIYQIKLDTFQYNQEIFNQRIEDLEKQNNKLKIELEKMKATEHQSQNQCTLKLNELEKLQQEYVRVSKECKEQQATDLQRAKQFKQLVNATLVASKQQIQQLNQKIAELVSN